MKKIILMCGMTLIASMAMAQDGKQIVQKAEQKMKALKSIEFSVSAQMQVSGMMQVNQNINATMAIVKPNKLAAKINMSGTMSQTQELYSDGKTLYAYMPSQKQYVKQPSPPNILENRGRAGDPVSMIMSLLGGNFTKDPNMQFKLLKSASVGGKDTHVVEMTPKKADPNGKMRALLYVGKADSLIHKAEFEQSSKMPAQGNQKPVENKMKATGTLKYISLDKAIPASRFAWKPPAGVKEMQMGGGGMAPPSAPRK
jgi:outer membrane lipoprotein-sorting protein